MAQITISRRGLLLGAGVLATGSPCQGTAAPFGHSFDLRRLKVYQLRERRASYHAVQPFPAPLNNGDETRFPNYLAAFSKTLPHNDLGEPDKASYEAFLKAVESGRLEDFEMVPSGGPAKLVNPLAASAFEMEGADPQQFFCPPPAAFDSAGFAGEMAELYWQSLTRDIAFSDYASSNLIREAAEELSELSGFPGSRIAGKITPDTIFRGPMMGDSTGPYISQFLWKDIPYGTTPLAQIYRTAESGVDYLTVFGEWLNLQRGIPPSAPMRFAPARRYIMTGRDLAAYVWLDFSFQAFLNAALVLNSFGGAAIEESNPYRTLKRQAAFATFGGPMILDLVARAANAALRSIWYQKWAIHRRIRPEAAAGRLHNLKTGKAAYPLHKDLTESQAVDMTFRNNGTFLLPQVYSEGSPVHPSFAAGHAGIAGACVTMLKAFFQGSVEVPNPVLPILDGSALLPYSGPPLTIGGELDKLASNVSIGRHWAGIHYWSDGVESMKIGEQVAIGILGDLIDSFPEEFGGFRFTRFDGTRVSITGR
ncbi:MAG TPA: hypothetical protein VM120_19630 [Bryobacteraceae bacterium]|nr:hypothetical protein [Bryobacteraceae bacterium]